MTIDQATWRRTRKLGLTAYDAAKAYPGVTLYAPMWGDGDVYLIDMQGNEIHRWRMPYPPGDYGYALPNGNIFYLGKTPVEPGTYFPPFQIFSGGALLEVDWEGNIVWERLDPDHHHDGRRTASGGAVYLTVEELPPEFVARVLGGLPGTEHEGRMWADRVVEIDTDGTLLWEWRAQDHMDPAAFPMNDADLRHEWTHGNTVVPLENGDVIVSFRGTCTVARIDRATGKFVWQLGRELLSQQHDPSLLENGNVLIFNNGTRRLAPLTYSSVIEVEPESGRLVWEYRDASSVSSFYSSYISGAQRLPNGNTLICEGLPGRIFEVTPEREVVWEYVNPHFGNVMAFGTTNGVFRAFRYDRERFPELR